MVLRECIAVHCKLHDLLGFKFVYSKAMYSSENKWVRLIPNVSRVALSMVTM